MFPLLNFLFTHNLSNNNNSNAGAPLDANLYIPLPFSSKSGRNFSSVLFTKTTNKTPHTLCHLHLQPFMILDRIREARRF
jgi:hypothetical protein